MRGREEWRKRIKKKRERGESRLHPSAVLTPLTAFVPAHVAGGWRVLLQGMGDGGGGHITPTSFTVTSWSWNVTRIQMGRARTGKHRRIFHYKDVDTLAQIPDSALCQIKLSRPSLFLPSSLPGPSLSPSLLTFLLPFLYFLLYLSAYLSISIYL